MKKTAVFIDHESWFYGMLNLHNELPDVDKVLGNIEKNNEVIIRKAFGNLPVTGNQNLIEKEKLNKYGYDLEYTYEGNVKGDLTDFVVVDNIYRTLMNYKDIQKFIILSGDAHYLQVIRTLKEFGKEVEIWGVMGTISAVFNIFDPIVISSKLTNNIRKKIVDEMYISESLSIPMTFGDLSDSICLKYGLEEERVKKELRLLITKGFLKEISFLTNKKRKFLKSTKELVNNNAM
jgi:hypothetical protein